MQILQIFKNEAVESHSHLFPENSHAYNSSTDRTINGTAITYWIRVVMTV